MTGQWTVDRIGDSTEDRTGQRTWQEMTGRGTGQGTEHGIEDRTGRCQVMSFRSNKYENTSMII